jgi:hypothetical protein
MTAQTGTGSNAAAQANNMIQYPGVLTRDPTTMNQQTVMQPGMKYVCCGGCRQWLLAPTEANLVVCNGCRSVNNCSLHPSGGASASQQSAPDLSAQQLTTGRYADCSRLIGLLICALWLSCLTCSGWLPNWLGGCFRQG